MVNPKQAERSSGGLVGASSGHGQHIRCIAHVHPRSSHEVLWSVRWLAPAGATRLHCALPSSAAAGGGSANSRALHVIENHLGQRPNWKGAAAIYRRCKVGREGGQ